MDMCGGLVFEIFFCYKFCGLTHKIDVFFFVIYYCVICGGRALIITTVEFPNNNNFKIKKNSYDITFYIWISCYYFYYVWFYVVNGCTDKIKVNLGFREHNFDSLR